MLGVRPLKKMTLTGTAKPGVSPATLAGQIDRLKGDTGGALLQLDMTIIGRLQLCGYNSRFNKSFSYVCSFEEGDVKTPSGRRSDPRGTGNHGVVGDAPPARWAFSSSC